MELKLEIEPTPVTPEIRFDIDAKRFLLKGRSMPENADKFYTPVINWLNENLSGRDMKANFDVVLDYYNTGSFIRLMALFDTLGELNKNGNQLSVRWFCEDGDQDNMDDGQSFKDVVKVPFEILVI